jgi:hypothetical protein
MCIEFGSNPFMFTFALKVSPLIVNWAVPVGEPKEGLTAVRSAMNMDGPVVPG